MIYFVTDAQQEVAPALPQVTTATRRKRRKKEITYAAATPRVSTHASKLNNVAAPRFALPNE